MAAKKKTSAKKPKARNASNESFGERRRRLRDKPPSATKKTYAEKIVAYYADIDNESISRDALAEKVLGVSRKTLYKHFDPSEIAELEHEGLRQRRARYASTSAKVDSALVARALKGDPQAIKLYYQRIENWSERSIQAIEPNLDELREYAIAKGYDPEEFLETFLELRRTGKINE